MRRFNEIERPLCVQVDARRSSLRRTAARRKAYMSAKLGCRGSAPGIKLLRQANPKMRPIICRILERLSAISMWRRSRLATNLPVMFPR